MCKKKELLIILILAVLATLLSGFFFGSSDVPRCLESLYYRCPDAFYYQGWPLNYLQTGGFVGVNRWLPLNFLLDVFFWLVILAAGWWWVTRISWKNMGR